MTSGGCAYVLGRHTFEWNIKTVENKPTPLFEKPLDIMYTAIAAISWYITHCIISQIATPLSGPIMTTCTYSIMLYTWLRLPAGLSS